MMLDDFYKAKELYVVKTLNGGFIKGLMHSVHNGVCYLTEAEFYLQDPESRRILCEKTPTCMIPLSAITSIAPPGHLVEAQKPGVIESTSPPVAPETQSGPVVSESAPSILSEIPSGLAAI